MKEFRLAVFDMFVKRYVINNKDAAVLLKTLKELDLAATAAFIDKDQIFIDYCGSILDIHGQPVLFGEKNRFENLIERRKHAIYRREKIRHKYENMPSDVADILKAQVKSMKQQVIVTNN